MIREHTQCRACGAGNLAPILDLGRTALANDFLLPSEATAYRTALPLRVVLCRNCSLLQLADTVDPSVLYSHYAYVTSTSRTMEAHLQGLREHLAAAARLGPASKVLEIASNTGVFLQKFRNAGNDVLGIEPAANIADAALAASVPTRKEFFGAATAPAVRDAWGAADLIVGRHVFAHIDNLQDLLAGLDCVSHRDTLAAFEVPYAVDLFERTEYDTIYHEHLSYVTVAAVAALVRDTPFTLTHVERYPIHGGSILFHLRRRDANVAPHPSVAAALEAERSLRLADPAAWAPFVRRVNRIRADLPALIRELRVRGKRIIGYGASAKGNTLLNTCGLSAKELDYIIDNTPFKQGRLTPGSFIPVRGPERLLQDQPDYALLLAWNFASEIVGRESEYQRRGGRFIVPIPEPRVIAPEASAAG
jgi:novobiocin biosynthesis protein NovU/D-mycarose 3-C-methyltransferase